MDVYYDLDASHPAEYIPFVFCCCDALGLSGEQAIRGILLAYDLQGLVYREYALQSKRVALRNGGFPQSARRYSGCFLSCDREQLANMMAVELLLQLHQLGNRRPD